MVVCLEKSAILNSVIIVSSYRSPISFIIAQYILLKTATQLMRGIQILKELIKVNFHMIRKITP